MTNHLGFSMIEIRTNVLNAEAFCSEYYRIRVIKMDNTAPKIPIHTWEQFQREGSFWIEGGPMWFDCVSRARYDPGRWHFEKAGNEPFFLLGRVESLWHTKDGCYFIQMNDGTRRQIITKKIKSDSPYGQKVCSWSIVDAQTLLQPGLFHERPGAGGVRLVDMDRLALTARQRVMLRGFLRRYLQSWRFADAMEKTVYYRVSPSEGGILIGLYDVLGQRVLNQFLAVPPMDSRYQEDLAALSCGTTA